MFGRSKGTQQDMAKNAKYALGEQFEPSILSYVIYTWLSLIVNKMQLNNDKPSTVRGCTVLLVPNMNFEDIRLEQIWERIA